MRNESSIAKDVQTGERSAHAGMLGLTRGSLVHGAVGGLHSGQDAPGIAEGSAKCSNRGLTGDVAGRVAAHSIRDGVQAGGFVYEKRIFIAIAHETDIG